MGRRRSSLARTFANAQRSIARAQREAEAAQRRQQRQQSAATRLARQHYQSEREQAVQQRNDQLTEVLEDLRDILDYVLAVPEPMSFADLHLHHQPTLFAPPPYLAVARPKPRPPNLLAKLFQGATDRYAIALERYEAQEVHRQQELEQHRLSHALQEHEAYLKIQEHNQEAAALERAYHQQQPSAVVSFNAAVLERSTYPNGLPRDFRLAYLPGSAELAIDYQLPEPTIVPSVSQFVYVKNRDAIEERSRKPTEIKEIYQDAIAAVTLRSLYEIFESNNSAIVATVVFNGFVRTVDTATGKDIQPYLISIRTTAQAFRDLDLRRVDKRACLRSLGAQISPRPAEMLPVKPILDLNMVDKRFVEQDDVLDALDARPNLMDLNPWEFENLVSNLFGKMGLESKLTRSSRDGGVDAVAFDNRPVLGGKVVIQAKRYRHTVGVSAVRDLYGTMINEGANKGILVTTSGYGPDAFHFAKDKPIELLDGSQLLYLLQQVGVEARIVFPAENDH